MIEVGKSIHRSTHRNTPTARAPHIRIKKPSPNSAPSSTFLTACVRGSPRTLRIPRTRELNRSGRGMVAGWKPPLHPGVRLGAFGVREALGFGISAYGV